jgi:hypothetical protein
MSLAAKCSVPLQREFSPSKWNLLRAGQRLEDKRVRIANREEDYLMRRGVRVLMAVAGLVVLLSGAAAGTTFAQGGGPDPNSVGALHSDPAWQATYWNNLYLSDAPALQRSEGAIDYDWGTGSPDPAIHADNFSARWTRYIDVVPGRYRFTATSDDGMRVWVDNSLLINEWYDHPPVTVSNELELGAGHHLVVVEYYENTGGAVARMTWGPASQTVRYWRGEYYNNPSLQGTPALVRDDPQVNFNWDYASPAPGVVNADYFSVRWTRTVDIPAGNYRFWVNVDDGVRLWVNGHLVIDHWQVQSVRTYAAEIYLPGGATSVKMEYFEQTGLAVAQLGWSTGSGSPPPPPQPLPGGVVVDNGGPGFSKGGMSSGWQAASGGWNGSYLWTHNNDWARPYYNWARWYPCQAGLIAGRYEVFVYIPAGYSTTAAANYWVSYAGGYTRRVVSQSLYGGQWVSLGTYPFRGDQSDYVSLSDVTGEPYLSRLIAFDAVKWVPR